MRAALRDLLARGRPGGPEWLRPLSVAEVYRRRGGAPLFAGSASGAARGAALLEEAAGAAAEGLDPDHYQPAVVESALVNLPMKPEGFWDYLTSRARRQERARALARIDALLVDRYLALAGDLRALPGSDSLLIASLRKPVAAESTGINDEAPVTAVSADTLFAALAAGTPPPVGAWRPRHPQYAALVRALATYRRVAGVGGWPLIDPGDKLKKNDHSPRVAQLRARLDAEERLLTGQAPPPVDNPDFYDAGLKERVAACQRRLALDDDGVAGKGTLDALNVSAADRVRQIERTLLRWRQGPHDAPDYRVEVNIPGMKLNLWQGDRSLLTLKTVVGSGKESPPWRGKTVKAETPQLEDQIETVEVNPQWNIPEIIIRTELLQKEKKKPGFLDDGGYEFFDPATKSFGPASQIPEEDWSNPHRRLILRQRSGAGNALGRIKFVFHNRFAVYLHDTPEKQYFKRGRRAFSHGCVRVENPRALADSLFARSEKKPPKSLTEMLKTDKRVVVPMVPPVPIHLVYRTAWVEDDGTVDFFGDLYGWDAAMDAPPADLSAAAGRGVPPKRTKAGAP